MKNRSLCIAVTIMLATAASVLHAEETKPVRMGSGLMTFDTVPGWGLRPDGTSALGPTHGAVVVDREGNIYTSADKGVVVFSPEGKERAYIRTPVLPTNCCFGLGDDAKTLYITAGSGFYRIRLAIEGHRR